MAAHEHPPTLDYRRPHRLSDSRARYVVTAEDYCWTFIRIAYRTGLFLILCPIIVHFGWRLILFHRFSNPVPAEFAPVANKCVPVIAAIKQYQRDTGQLPRVVFDLSPKYLSSSQGYLPFDVVGSEVWFFDFDQFNDSVIYNLTPGCEGWRVKGAFTNGAIPVPAVVLPPPATRPITHP